MFAIAPLFSLRGASKHFDRFTALSDVTLDIFPGERVALVGPSGAGKSTSIALLNGSLSPSAGEVRSLGQPLGRLPPRQKRKVQRQIGTIYQKFHLVESLQVIHNVNGGHLGRWPVWKAALSLLFPLEVETALQALHQVGIPEKLYDRTGNLSGGQQQRVAIARVLVQNPLAILADEPVSSLDPERGREILSLLGRLCEGGRTLVASLHDIELAKIYFDRIIGLRQGQLWFDLPARSLSPDKIQSLYRIDDRDTPPER